MSWHCLQELVEEYSPESCLDGEQFARLSLKTTQDGSCCSDRETDCFLYSQSGTMCEPSMGILGEEKWTLCLEDFLARISAQREKEQESTESVQASGVKWHESYLKYDRDTHGWKTHHCLWEEDLPWYSVTLPKWGMMRDGELYQRKTPELYTRERGSGSWPTPQASDNRDRGCMQDESVKKRIKKRKQIGLSTAVKEEKQSGTLSPDWTEWLIGWPIGWTDLKPLATDNAHNQPHWHGVFSQKESSDA